MTDNGKKPSKKTKAPCSKAPRYVFVYVDSAGWVGRASRTRKESWHGDKTLVKYIRADLAKPKTVPVTPKEHQKRARRWLQVNGLAEHEYHVAALAREFAKEDAID